MVAVAAILAAGTMALHGAAHGAEDWRNLYLDAKPVLDFRYRFEYVDRGGVPRDARAHTARTRAGFETGRLHGIGAGFDVEWIETIGHETFNDTINGKTRYPVVADPEDEQLNQLYIVSNNMIPDTLLKLGRQRVIWDDARFIGNVGFRQNEQTFDGFRGIVSALPDTTVEYLYTNQVRRIFGTDSPAGDPALDGHGLRGRYTGIDGLAVTVFALWLDYDDTGLAGLDTASYGLLARGSHPIDDDWTLLYSAAAAYQEDQADNPADVDLWYYRIEPGVAYGDVRVMAGLEVLQGDGTSAFRTPLATLHKFNGLTDQFLNTPADGLEDLYLTLALPVPGGGWLAGVSFKAGYHQFRADRGDAHYGREWDAGLFKKIATRYGTVDLGLQFARYDADRFSRDTDRLWATAQFRFAAEPLRRYLEEGDD